VKVDLRSFIDFANTHKDADSAVIQNGEVRSEPPSALPRWAISFTNWLMPGWGHVAADNRAAVDAFHEAIHSRYGFSNSSAFIPSDRENPLTSNRITQTIKDVTAEVRLSARAHARANPASEISDAALNAVMDTVKLPEGPHGELVAGEVRQALKKLHNRVAQFDATSQATLLPELGRQLAARLNEGVTRALINLAQNSRGLPDVGNRSLEGESVEHALNLCGRALEGLCERVPGLRVKMDVETAAFTRNVEKLLERLEHDHNVVFERFFGVEPPTSLANLHGVTVTNSDPHKGGNRVVILDFGADKKVVYKPRDVRIDDALSGAQRLNDCPSMMEIAGAKELTYKFLPRRTASDEFRPGKQAGQSDGNQDDHYGYVQYLPNGSASEFLADHKEAQKYYHLLGRGAAAMMLAGARDLHHENIMVSGRKPYFSDLEFALVPKVYSQVTTLLAASKPDDAVKAFDKLMGVMTLDMAVKRALDKPPKLEYYIDSRGNFQLNAGYENVTENLLVVRHNGTLLDTHGALQALPIEEADAASQGNALTLNSRYSSQFAEGVKDGLISSWENLAQCRQILADAAKFHVRIHPITTLAQRALLMSAADPYYAVHAGSEPQQAAWEQQLRLSILDSLKNMDMAQRSPLNQDRFDRQMADMMLASYRKHDVPYFCRRMDDHRLFFDGDTPVHIGQGGEQSEHFFDVADSGWLTVASQLEGMDKGGITSLATTLRHAAATWLKNQVPMQGGCLDLRWVNESKTRKLLEGVGAKPADFVPTEDI
jgi:hypothetical protein